MMMPGNNLANWNIVSNELDNFDSHPCKVLDSDMNCNRCENIVAEGELSTKLQKCRESKSNILKFD